MIEQQEKINFLTKKIDEIATQKVSIMEVCGTHTMSVAKHAVRSFLPENVNIISGPGCPVCVTSQGDIQQAIDLAKRDDVIIATFGDMLKIPSKKDSLIKYKNVKLIYSPLDSLKIAQENPDKEVVLLGVGFETTVPLIASTIKEAHRLDLKNFSVLPMHKLVPPVMDAIFADSTNQVDALLLPGHVSVVTGSDYFEFIQKYKIPGVIAGFEAVDILEAIYLLVKAAIEKKPVMINHYKRLVKKEGNQEAMAIFHEVYEPCETEWRKIGTIPLSGLRPREKYQAFDANKKFKLQKIEMEEAKGCLCGEILIGKAKPLDCRLFGSACTPLNPIGPCMVSSEGTCAAFYKYNL